jgi:hypothetical protein
MLFPAEPAAFLTESRLSPPESVRCPAFRWSLAAKLLHMSQKPHFCNLKFLSPADSNRTRGAVYSPLKPLCGLCLRPSQMCQYYLVKGKGANGRLRVDLKMSKGCLI